MNARLPADKHKELIELLEEWTNKRSCKLKDLQSLAGKLSHACSIVPQGRTFLRCFLDLSGNDLYLYTLITNVNWTLNGGDLFCLTGTVYISLIYPTGPPFLTFFPLQMHRVAKDMGHSTLVNGSTARGLLLNSHYCV